MLQIDKRTTSPYHPRANGTVERANAEFKHILQKYAEADLSRWVDLLPSIQLRTNCRITARHGSTPFTVMFARSLNGFMDYSDIELTELTENELYNRLKMITDILLKN